MFITANGLAVDDGSVIVNGAGRGDFGRGFQGVYFEPGLLRPFLSESGEICVTANSGRTDKDGNPVYATYAVRQLQAKGLNCPVWNMVNNATTLRKEDWINLDKRVVLSTRKRMTAWADLMNAASVGGINGMSKMTHEYEAMTDPGEAVVDMDAITDGRRDQPQFKLRSVPLPITHSDFSFSQRRIAVSANSGTPVSTTMGEACGRRVGEMIEKTTIGVETGVTYGTQSTGITAHDGTSTAYGYTNFPYRVTKTDLTTPTGSNPEAILSDVLEMVETMQTNGFYGPWVLYHSTPYSRYLNDDYFRTGSTSAVRSVRQRLMEIDGISRIQRLDFLTSGFQLILLELGNPDVAEAINGMDVTTVQWPEKGGLQLCFKVMAIQTALMKAPYNQVAGMIHGTTS